MAIDTRTKRQNAAQVGCPLPVSVFPIGGMIGPNRRAQIAWTYGGIQITPPVQDSRGFLAISAAPSFSAGLSIKRSFTVEISAS